jgi:hypothetical protein
VIVKYLRAVAIGLLVGAVIASWFGIAAGVIVGLAAIGIMCEEEDE